MYASDPFTDEIIKNSTQYQKTLAILTSQLSRTLPLSQLAPLYNAVRFSLETPEPSGNLLGVVELYCRQMISNQIQQFPTPPPIDQFIKVFLAEYNQDQEQFAYKNRTRLQILSTLLVFD